MITDPNAAAHLSERDRLIKTGSGISQVQNPIKRGLLRAADIAGTAFFPNITAQIPGTELHHQGLVRRSEGIVDKDVTRAKENAGTENLEAETQKNLRPPIATNDLELWAQQNPGKPVEEFLKTKRDNAPEHNETAFDAWRKQNPNTPVEDWLKANSNQQENTHVLPDGTVIAVHNDPKSGKSTAEVVYQGKPNEKPGHVIQRLVNGKLHNVLVDAETGQDRQDLGETRQPNAPSNDHGVTMIGKDGKVYRLEPGQNVPEGAQTPTQAGSVNTPTTQTRTMVEAAPKVIGFVDRIGKMIDQQAASLGPAASRWSEFMAGKVGAPNPDFTKLRTDVALLQTALMRMHVGARGGEQMMEHFRDLIDVSKQSPENLKAALEEIREYANAVTAHGGNQGAGAGGEQKVPTVTSKAEYDALPSGATYMEDGKKYKKP